MGAKEVQPHNARFYVFEAITVVLMFAGFFIHGGALPDYGWQVLFIFLGLLFGWATVGLIIPSLLGIVALSFTEGFTIQTAWAAGFGGEIVSLVIIYSIIAKWLEDIGLTDLIMNWFMSRKSLQGKPWLFMTCFLLIIYLLGFLVGMFAAILIGWAFAYKICEDAGYEKKSPFCAFLVVYIVILAALGNYCKPWGAWGITAIKTYQSTIAGGDISFPAFFGWCVVVHMCCLALMLIVSKFIVHFDLSKLGEGDFTHLANNIKATGDQKFASVLMIVMIIALFIPSYLPDCALKTGLNTLSTVGVGLAVMIIAGGVRTAQGKFRFNFNHVVNIAGSIPWGAVMLLAATVPLGNALRAKEAGIMTLLTAFAKTHMGGMSAVVYLIVVAVFMFLLTQVAHNLVCLVSISPIFIVIGQSVGVSTALVMMICQMVLTFALGTPAASTRAGMLYGNSEYITIGQCYKYSWITGISCLVATLIVGIPLGLVMFP